MEIKKGLLEKAVAAQKNAYAPYSGYKVGAAVLSESGNIYASCNVENVSFPCGTCGEAGAIAAMIAAGERKIVALLVVAAGEKTSGEELVRPCGACLQRIAEFADKDTPVYLADIGGIKEEYHLRELLPQGFKAAFKKEK